MTQRLRAHCTATPDHTMTQKIFFHLARVAAALVAASGFVQCALADNNGRAVPLLPLYKQECAACHVAYPPTLMPAASWTRIMANLPKHFVKSAANCGACHTQADNGDFNERNIRTPR